MVIIVLYWVWATTGSLLVSYIVYFENIEGKGENAGYQHFLLFPQCFLPYH